MQGHMCPTQNKHVIKMPVHGMMPLNLGYIFLWLTILILGWWIHSFWLNQIGEIGLSH